MTNREYIDQINTFINNFLQQELTKNEYISRDFFDDKELKIKISNVFNSLTLAGMIPELNEEKFDKFYEIAIKEQRYKNKQGMTPSISLTNKNEDEFVWLSKERIEELGWNRDELNTYRTRYLYYLKEIGRSGSYIDETKRSSLEIVKKLGDPKSENAFFTRGLVVGSVQSGKTANFNAVINSAIDVGYDLIIVLSGIMEDLRVQTQKRIEKEVEGKYVSGSNFMGVGNIASFGPLGQYKEVHQIILPTSTETDFKKTIKEADFSLNNKNILICKKNSSVLKNLILWLDNYLNENKDKIEIPFLIVDDEADNASLNNLGHKGREEASTINGHIRSLLALFKKKTYLGYTATPFANVLQDRNEKPLSKWIIDDKGIKKEFEQESSLFPRDFIELLFPPSNYIGAKHFFETRYEDIKKIEPLVALPIDDYLEAFPPRLYSDTDKPTFNFGKGTRATKKADVFPKENSQLPNSLKDAIKCFIISTAIRISREKETFDSKVYQPHNTMLIHISRFTSWQTRTKGLIETYVNELTSSLNNELPSSSSGIYAEFEKIWNKYYAYVMENIWNYLPDEYEDKFLNSKTFKEIKPLLIKSVSDIDVKAINSETKDSLTYSDDKPKKYIAIGGNRLSRGFTLEGLTINYFIRNTNFADTLLQMGRWFGYRPSYIDCCKLFTTVDLLEKFDQTTATIEDLEQKFIEMNKNPNNTPDNYALRVLKHPGVLKLTRPAILKNTKEVNWSYSDHLIQTTKFNIDNKRINNSWEHFLKYIGKIKNKFLIKKDLKGKVDYLEYQIDNINELFNFLQLPNTFYDKSDKKETDYFIELIEYIKLCNEKNKLTKWSIVIKVSGDGNIIKSKDSSLNIDIFKTVRGGFDSNSRWGKELLNNHLFAAGGNSSNILGGGKDMQIRLDSSKIKEVTEEFKSNLFKDLKIKYPNLNDKEIQKKVDKTGAPEKIFRKSMKEEEGLLIIYLMDLEAIFKHKDKEVPELKDLKNSVDTNIPLIGYAIGIPEIDSNIGGNYLESIFYKEEIDIEEEEEVEDDAGEVLNAYDR